MTTRRNIATPSSGPRYAIVPPLVHLYGAPCYQHLPGDGGAVPDLEGAASNYLRCPRCFPPVKARNARGRYVKKGV